MHSKGESKLELLSFRGDTHAHMIHRHTCIHTYTYTPLMKATFRGMKHAHGYGERDVSLESFVTGAVICQGQKYRRRWICRRKRGVHRQEVHWEYQAGKADL